MNNSWSHSSWKNESTFSVLAHFWTLARFFNPLLHYFSTFSAFIKFSQLLSYVLSFYDSFSAFKITLHFPKVVLSWMLLSWNYSKLNLKKYSFILYCFFRFNASHSIPFWWLSGIPPSTTWVWILREQNCQFWRQSRGIK